MSALKVFGRQKSEGKPAKSATTQLKAAVSMSSHISSPHITEKATGANSGCQNRIQKGDGEACRGPKNRHIADIVCKRVFLQKKSRKEACLCIFRKPEAETIAAVLVCGSAAAVLVCSGAKLRLAKYKWEKRGR